MNSHQMLFSFIWTIMGYLDSLVSVAHHGNEQVDEHNCSDEKIQCKDYFEKFKCPVINSVSHL
jgi:hypothetical protein